MIKGRRTANRVRKVILDGIFDYDERRMEMAAAAENRRREELRRQSQAKCGTACHDIPDAWFRKMQGYFPAGSAQAVSQAAMLN